MTDLDPIRSRHERAAWERYRGDDGMRLKEPVPVETNECVVGDLWGEDGCDTAVVLAALAEHDRIHQMDTDHLRSALAESRAGHRLTLDAMIRYRQERDRFITKYGASRLHAEALAAMLSEAAWAIDHTCTQCGDTQPSHTPRCPTYLALAAHEEASHAE